MNKSVSRPFTILYQPHPDYAHLTAEQKEWAARMLQDLAEQLRSEAELDRLRAKYCASSCSPSLRLN